ncbi:Protein of unknown function [Cotesia congregata]|uniref:THAP-type domain-containing protein n=1 Tax=Cotesia congregata TaxID=51543 RepID=A0A8J2EMF9_COTCN|nr:Protein of unknown function [Cotesia congregata]
MIICCVKDCRHKKPKDQCKLHRLPKDEKFCKEWVRRIGVEELLYKSLKDLNNVYLCSCHFTKQDYRSSKYLNPGAIPTQFSDDTHPISDEKMEKFSNFIRFSTTASLEPLTNILNSKIVNLRQLQTITVINNDVEQPFTEEVQQLMDIEDNTQTLFVSTVDENLTINQPIVKRKKSSDFSTEKPSCTITPAKRLRPSALYKVKPYNLSQHLLKINALGDSKQTKYQQSIKNDKSVELAKSNIRLKKLEQLCKSLKSSVLDDLIFKIDLLVNYYDKQENLV